MQASDTVTILEDGERTYYIVGTAHVSKESVEEVQRVIDEVKPDAVCVELCATRYAALTDEDRWKKLDIFKVIREGKTLLLLANLAVGAYQRRLGAELGVQPGAELLAGAAKAKEIGAELCLVDREIQITLKRTWANLGFFKKMQLLGTIIESLVTKEETVEAKETIEQLKQKAHLSEMMQEFVKVMPEVHQPLIDERDQYLMSKIERAPGKTIVAVVGAGHVPGMQRYFKKSVDLADLETLPVKRRWTGLLKWIIPAIILAAFYFGFSKNEGKTFEQLLYAWILPNSVFALILTAIAGGKLLSVVTATIASPITSLNPLIGAGMVTGLVEAWLRKPTVEDAENINRDVQSLRGFYRNGFTRVLLVAVASTLGSALGAWIGLAWVVKILV
ncbi:MAG: TraB/GumN family protein [Myxococcales bacterium]|nr:TraB/GumN family protein [Myxococcales bacterium]